MTILAIHRRQPNWPPDPARPIFQMQFGGIAYYVETNGPAPTDPEIDAILNPPPAPLKIPLDLLQARIEAEGGWDTYVNFMFATATRRNAFLKTSFKGKPIAIDASGFITSLQGAGFTAQQIARITAPYIPT